MSVERVSAGDFAASIRALERDGAVILENFTTLEDLDAVNNDLNHQLKKMKEQPLDFFPSTTETCFFIYGRSKTAREKWMYQETWLKVRNHFLTSTHVPYQAQRQEEFSTEPILSTSFSSNVTPGTEAQLLHRDDISWMRDLPDRTKTGYQAKDELGIALLVAGCKAVEENGATRVILGSHLWPNDRRGTPEESVGAALNPGDALINLGSVVHGGGENRTDENRVIHVFVFCRSYLRPEGNIFPLFSRKEVDTWSEQTQHWAGYRKGHLYIGHSDLHDPIECM